MKMKSITVLIILLLLSSNVIYTQTDINLQILKQGMTVSIGMEENTDWPPYEYFERIDGIRTEKLIGYAVDVIAEILSSYDLNYNIEYFPLLRCLEYLESGEKIQVVLPTSLNDDRRDKYYISEYAYSVTPSYYYMKEKFPDGPDISSVEELLQYGSVYGKFGYNYSNFGIEEESSLIRLKDFDSIINMLEMGRANFLLARSEPFSGLSLVGENYLHDGIAQAPIPGISRENFYYLISKKHPYGEELLQIINKGIIEMRNRGRLEEIMDIYISKAEFPN